MQVYALSHAISINRRPFYYNVEKLFRLLTFVDFSRGQTEFIFWF